jgi:hypothetical protein
VTTFIPAAELITKFCVFGHFYAVSFPSEVVHCRSVLEIVAAKGMPAQTARLSNREPDAVFIMMNPGSSKPLVEVNNVIRAKDIHQLQISLVPTKPDTTQYQVMRVMRARNWKHVRVLNLSDLRSPKSVEFCRQYRRLEQEFEFESHSIFSDARGEELSAKLPRYRRTPVVLGWGLSNKLDPLVERCLARIPKRQVVRGLLANGATNKYRHPLPSLQRDKLAWVAEMIRHLR